MQSEASLGNAKDNLEHKEANVLHEDVRMGRRRARGPRHCSLLLLGRCCQVWLVRGHIRPTVQPRGEQTTNWCCWGHTYCSTCGTEFTSDLPPPPPIAWPRAVSYFDCCL